MKKSFKKMLYFLLVVLIMLLALFCFLFIGKAPNVKNIVWGVDFSQMQAEFLKLNWKEAYSAIINDLGVKHIKLHTQWDWVEGNRGKYYFKDIDWQIFNAEEKDVKIIYVLGLKSGRWPECHAPNWVKNISEDEQKDAILKYIKEVVLRYKDSKAIEYWQVENEPLFAFGECPSWYYKDRDFLKEEVNLVKSLDPSRKVIVSDSGEYSWWFGAAKRGDIVGITMYRHTWTSITKTFGFYFKYLFSPVYYSRKATIIKELFKKDTICVELQMEPWISGSFLEASIKVQFNTMNPEIFDENVKFAKESGLNKFYLWGVEWWYWMKEKHNQPEIWDKAKQLFNEKPTL